MIGALAFGWMPIALPFALFVNVLVVGIALHVTCCGAPAPLETNLDVRWGRVLVLLRDRRPSIAISMG
jgi:hypothetical protein